MLSKPMRIRYCLVLCCILLLAICESGSRAEEEVKWDYKKFNAWARVGIGSSITIRNESQGESMYMKYTLSERNDTTYTLLIQMLDSEKKETSRFSQSSAIKPKFLSGRKTGWEILEIDGKEYACEIWKYTESTHGDGETKIKEWICPELHARLKYETYTDKPVETRTEVEAVKINDVLKINGKEYLGIRLEGSTNMKNHAKGTITLWRSNKVPGDMLKQEAAMSMMGTLITSTLILDEYTEKK